MRKLLLCSVLAVSFLVYSQQGYAKNCRDDSIRSVSSDGQILVMLSGSVYEVDQIDRIDSALWLAADDVLICDDNEIINTDEQGEKVSAARIK